jgi:sigma-B regulation protein RsbU (phosphoserine phosphatase)
LNDQSSNRRPQTVPDETAEELYEMAPCGYLTTTIDGHIVKVNKTLADWLGYEPGELTGGSRFVQLLTAGGRIFYETHFDLLLRMQDSVNEIALDIIRKDGHVLPTLINARQKRDANGIPVLNRLTISTPQSGVDMSETF